VRGEPVSQRCESPQQCVQIKAIGTYSPAGQAPSPWWPALTMTTWPMR
jgi:hypothetical protein